VLYRLEELTHIDVVDIARLQAHSRPNGAINSSQRPVVDVDCNNIINVVGAKSDDPVQTTALFLKKWASFGLVVVPICDGTRRPTAKQATNRNRAIRVKAAHNAIVARQELQQLNNKLEHDLLNNAQRTQLLKDRKKLEGKVKSSETQSTNVVPSDLPSQLSAALSRLSADKPHEVTGGYVGAVLTSWFQADALMGGRHLSGQSQLLMSNDGDMPAFFGDNCISIKKFTGNKLTISSTLKETLRKAISCLSPESQSKVNLVEPQHPIFEGITKLQLRALMSVIIGCDVCPGGVKSAGPLWVEKVLASINKQNGPDLDEDVIYEKLMEHAVEKSRQSPNNDPKYNKDVLTTFVHGIIYEPTNAHPDDDQHPVPTYIVNEPPSNLCKYLEEFKAESTAIYDGPAVLRCKGSSTDASAGHNFLAAEDNYNCAMCTETICQFCSDSIDKKHYCLGCYINEKVLPSSNAGDVLTVKEMRDELRYKYGFENTDKLRVDEIQEAWEAHELHRELEKMVGSVNFPVFPTSAIKSGEYWTHLADIDFSFGGSFLLDPKIDEQHIPGILDLFASLVRFDRDGKKYTDWEKESPVFSVMPEIYIEFASECRAKGIGFRLLKRCLRHAFDSRMKSLDDKVAKLILYEGEVGIHIQTEVPASMKQEKYYGDTVLTKNKLLAVSCQCKSGSNGAEKIACVHSLPRPFMLTILLAEDLAEHILLELTSTVTSSNVEKDTWDSDKLQSMKQSVVTLAKASGNNGLAEEMEKSASLYEMLQHFQTGTQKTKEWNRAHGPPTSDEIGPITKILTAASTPVQDAKKLFGLAEDKPNVDPREEINLFTPDYIHSGMLLNAAGIKTYDYPFIGFKLFDVRRKKQLHDFPIDDVQYSEMLFNTQAEWKSLMEEANNRTTRRSTKQMNNLKTNKDTTSVTPSPCKRKREDIAATPCLKGDSKRKPAARCAKVGCSNTTEMKWLSFHHLPPRPKKLSPNPTKAQTISYRGKLWLREEAMDRLGFDRDEMSEAMRVCSAHGIETVRKSFQLTHSEKTFTQLYEFVVIPGAGSKSSLCPSEDSKGVGRDRLIHRHLTSVAEKSLKQAGVEESVDNETEIERERRLRQEAEANVASAWLVAQQVVECSSPDTPSPICPSVSKAAGLVPSKTVTNSHPSSRKLFQWKAISSSTTKQSRSADKAPRYNPTTITNVEVKRRTGFSSINNLLAYIIIICNGDFERIRSVRRTSLMWFEHFFLYFEWTYHNTCNRQTDLEDEWGIDHRHINNIKDSVAALEMAALQSWPLLATYAEDMELRDATKWSAYHGKRAIFHDMTNIPCPQFENASLQRATYSEYYGMNCLKAGVCCQLSGWVGVWDLWGGGVSDSDYNKRSGYLEAQRHFQETDLVDGKVKKFHNVYDRGYRAKMATWQCGKQMAVQPPNAKSDKRFKGKQTLYTGIIAHDRSGNERSVNVSKRSSLFKRGFQIGMSPKRFNYAWRSWAFRSNFMYKPVL
jgi:hypothetical protein